METERLYYEDAYLKECTATVLACRQSKKGYEIVLDRTVFYPEGGGQPADQGYLNQVQVYDVHERGGELLHYTREPLEEGQQVLGRIDWERRFDLMQQHSGEHMVSGLIHERYGYDNVGFHMGSDVITIDFNGELTQEQMEEMEKLANEKVWENQKVEITYPSPEELEILPYRSKKELTGEVRIVRFPGADLCACCGTHVARAGEVGMIKLLSVQKFREGVRMEMICGRRVLEYLNCIDRQNHQVSVLLSAKPEKTAEAVKRLQEESYRQKGRIAALEEQSFAGIARQYADAGDVLVLEAGLDADGVRKLTDLVMKSCKGRCALFSDNGDGTFKYAMGQENGDLRSLTKAMNQALNGRGGGKPFFVQGSVQASVEEIKEFFQVQERAAHNPSL